MKKTWVIVVNVVLIAAILGFVAFYANYEGKTYYRRQMEALFIEIHYGYEVRTVQEFGNQPVIVATGAVPRILKDVKGHEKMIEACDYLLSEPGAAEAEGAGATAAAGETASTALTDPSTKTCPC